jgi:RNA polymerase sigma-70 factor (ECF subfamily)
MEEQHRRKIGELYSQCADEIHAYARRRSDSDVADDVVMEVFVIACRRLDDIPADALPWLLACARRVLANQRRRTARADALVDRLMSAASGSGLGTAEAGVLAEALATLPDRDRELLLLTAWEGLDLGEAARVLGCSRGAAGVRLHRARKRLNRALDHQTADRADRADGNRPEVAR